MKLNDQNQETVSKLPDNKLVEFSSNIELVKTNLIKFPNRRLRTRKPKVFEKLCKSLQRFGIVKPILIDGNHNVIDGLGILEAAIELGFDTIPVIVIDCLTPAEIKALRISLNKLQELGDWDAVVLKDEFESILELDAEFDLDVSGFDIGEIDLVLESETEEQNEDGNSEGLVPDINGQAVSTIGDQFLLGRHLLRCGDALSLEDIQAVLSGKNASMVFIDPPYNVKVDGHIGGLGKTKHREFVMGSGEMSQKQFYKFLHRSIKQLSKACMDGAILYICMDWRSLELVLKAGRKLDLRLINICVWNKTNGGMGSLYRSKNEMIVVLKKGTAPHTNNVELGKHGRYRTNVWDYPGVNTFSKGRMELLKAHPTVKPEVLVRDAILDVTNRGDVVLDTFTGSGTTLIAAEKAGRNACCIELDPIYVDTIIKRFEQLFVIDAIHEESGLTFAQLAQKRLKQDLTDDRGFGEKTAPSRKLIEANKQVKKLRPPPSVGTMEGAV